MLGHIPSQGFLLLRVFRSPLTHQSPMKVTTNHVCMCLLYLYCVNVLVVSGTNKFETPVTKMHPFPEYTGAHQKSTTSGAHKINQPLSPNTDDPSDIVLLFFESPQNGDMSHWFWSLIHSRWHPCSHEAVSIRERCTTSKQDAPRYVMPN